MSRMASRQADENLSWLSRTQFRRSRPLLPSQNDLRSAAQAWRASRRSERRSEVRSCCGPVALGQTAWQAGETLSLLRWMHCDRRLSSNGSSPHTVLRSAWQASITPATVGARRVLPEGAADVWAKAGAAIRTAVVNKQRITMGFPFWW